VDLDGTSVLLVRVGERVYACGAVCAHRGGPLAEGKLTGTRLTCPWHGWMYEIRTGECLFPPRGSAVPAYATGLDDGHIWVDVPAAGAPAC
jgi:nitrite reductase/ring-hydroxylating ferredoxin subunit